MSASAYQVYLGTEYDRANWILNPSFETSAGVASSANWITSGLTSSTSNADAYAGDFSRQWTSSGTSATAHFRNDYQSFPLNLLGTGFRAFCYLKATAGNSRNVRIDLEIQDSLGNVTTVQGTPVTLTVGGAWTRVEVSTTIPYDPLDTGKDVRVKVYTQLTNGSSTNVILADAACLETFAGDTPASFYFDGSETAYLPAGIQNLFQEWEGFGDGTDQISSLYGVTWTILDDVLDVQATIGKRSDTEPTSPSSASISARYPDGWASPNPLLKTSQRVQIRRVGRSASLWEGRITDVRAEWGQPYVGTTGNQDFLRITAEGALGQVGRETYDFAFLDESPISVVLGNLSTYNTGGAWASTPGDDPVVIATIGERSGAEQVNTAAATYNAYVIDGVWDWYVSSQYLNREAAVSFSDTGQSSLVRSFESATYDSLAENYMNKLLLEYWDGELDYWSGTYPRSEVRIATFARTQTDLDALANDLLDKYSTQSLDISEISCLEEAQTTMNLDSLEGPSSTDSWAEVVGKTIQVTLRGVTQTRRIVGAAFTATPGSARYTYYLSAAASVPYFLLDDPDRGVLNTNRLGW